MKIIIQKAKNDEETASVDGHFLHSNYAPVKEAQRFADNLTIPYTPSAIIITEPGLSYLADILKEKFPFSKIGAIRYCDAFNSYNSSFDFVLNYYEHKNFEAFLEASLSEEILLTTFFVSWPASAQIFTEEEKAVWNAIKASMQRAKTLLITRQYFEKKWLLNSLHFIKNIKSAISFNEKINKDALIISSGPSLNPFIPLIKENQNKFFIICLSSAITVCLKNNIRPDLCMTTDGGFWAGQHLKALNKTSIPLAIASEAYCPAAILSKLSLLPLDYGDGISSNIMKASNISSKAALRNGTVSVTALSFAAQYCTKDIYLCGLDMACQKGFQHSQPNQLEINSSLKDNRIKTKTLRLTRSELTNGSLDIYKDWFINNPLKSDNRKTYRLIQEKDKKNSLGWIKDINLEDFEETVKKITASQPVTFKNENTKADTAAVIKLFTESSENENWKKLLFPLDYVQLSHNPDNKEIQNKIDKEWETLKKSAEKILL